MKYMVTMYNDMNMDIDSDVVESSDENEAIETFLREHHIIIYSGDRFEAEPYWERD